jgi:hypothetical protein
VSPVSAPGQLPPKNATQAWNHFLRGVVKNVPASLRKSQHYRASLNRLGRHR